MKVPIEQVERILSVDHRSARRFREVVPMREYLLQGDFEPGFKLFMEVVPGAPGQVRLRVYHPHKPAREWGSVLRRVASLFGVGHVD